MLHNSMLSQRLTLLPLKYDTLEKYPNCEISLNIINKNLHMIDIYTKDFKISWHML